MKRAFDGHAILTSRRFTVVDLGLVLLVPFFCDDKNRSAKRARVASTSEPVFLVRKVRHLDEIRRPPVSPSETSRAVPPRGLEDRRSIRFAATSRGRCRWRARGQRQRRGFSKTPHRANRRSQEENWRRGRELGPYSCLGPNSPALSLRVATPVVRTPVQWRRRRQGASAALASAGEIFPAPVNKGVNAALPPLPVADPAGGEWAHAGAVTVPAATPSLPRALARRCGRRLRRRPVPCVSALAGADDGGCGGGAGASLLTCSLAHLLTCSLAHLLS